MWRSKRSVWSLNMRQWRELKFDICSPELHHSCWTELSWDTGFLLNYLQLSSACELPGMIYLMLGFSNLLVEGLGWCHIGSIPWADRFTVRSAGDHSQQSFLRFLILPLYQIRQGVEFSHNEAPRAVDEHWNGFKGSLRIFRAMLFLIFFHVFALCCHVK